VLVAKQKEKTGIEHLENNPINWFPGHMNKAITEIKKNIKLVNIVLEIRDARAPLASGNKENYDNSGEKPYLIVINKTNLADPEAVELWKEWFTKKNESFIFINALDIDSIKTVVKRAREVLHAHRLKSNVNISIKNEMTMMVLGLPNTGKSTIINKLSNRNATKAASNPGQTKVKLWVKADKDLKILDTPGVMPPRIHKQIHGMWLSAIHAIPDHIITPEYSACFIVEHLLKTRSAAFQEFYKLESLDIDLLTTLEHIGKRRGCLRTGGGYDYEHVYKIVLMDFRKGSLGLTCFELPPVKQTI
jgi:ribosome biogenesis GTPase A